jgi:hypothetical protein
MQSAKLRNELSRREARGISLRASAGAHSRFSSSQFLRRCLPVRLFHGEILFYTSPTRQTTELVVWRTYAPSPVLERALHPACGDEPP